MNILNPFIEDTCPEQTKTKNPVCSAPAVRACLDPPRRPDGTVSFKSTPGPLGTPGTPPDSQVGNKFCECSKYPIFKKILFIFIFKERGREGEKEGEKHQCAGVSCAPPSRDLAHNPGMCPDWESDE